MKCDELTPLVFSISDLAYVDEPTPQPNFQNPHDHAVYKATEVDAAIAELKQKLETVNELVKTARQMLEDAKATHYAEMVDAGMRERRLKRALWLARALRAKERKYKYETWDRHEERKVYKDYDMIAIVSRKARMWRKVERKCRAKAEEYK